MFGWLFLLISKCFTSQGVLTFIRMDFFGQFSAFRLLTTSQQSIEKEFTRAQQDLVSSKCLFVVQLIGGIQDIIINFKMLPKNNKGCYSEKWNSEHKNLLRKKYGFHKSEHNQTNKRAYKAQKGHSLLELAAKGNQKWSNGQTLKKFKQPRQSLKSKTIIQTVCMIQSGN